MDRALKPNLFAEKSKRVHPLLDIACNSFVLNTGVYKTKQLKSQLVNQLVDYMVVERLDLTLGYELQANKQTPKIKYFIVPKNMGKT